MSFTSEIQNLIGAGSTEVAIEKMQKFLEGKDVDLKNMLTTLAASFRAGKRQNNMGVMSSAEWAQLQAKTNFGILDMLSAPIFNTDSPEPVADNQSSKNEPIKQDKPKGATSVFISYNHKDSEVANKLNASLRAAGFEVIQDVEAMKAGAIIRQFIIDSVANSDVTLSLVSNNSLKSGWVATETINTFFLENFKSDKKFIAVYIDGDFFNNRFVIDATKEIDVKIKELDDLMKEYAEYKIDSTDLNNEKTRLFQLRNNLGNILVRLRESLCIDIKNDNYDKNIGKVIDAIKS